MYKMYDIISRKKRGEELTADEIEFFINGYTSGVIPDYQAAALLMAIYWRGMSGRETFALTGAMAASGDMIDLSAIAGKKSDKHSTGGVGDKTTLIVAPIVAACGGRVAKMSGRGLGHTGGTIDKLEAIAGFRTTLDRTEFFRIVNEIGLAVIGQSGQIAPADKKLYALRDVTATVDSLPLIASSIMSKKLAAGADAIVLDVKTGSGAFMKTLDDSIALAGMMVEIGEAHNRATSALITDMDEPLGQNIGNALEVVEAIDVLNGEGAADLTEVSLSLAAEMLYLSDLAATPGEGRKKAKAALDSGAAREKLCAMVRAQGGDEQAVRNPALLGRAPFEMAVKAPADGYIAAINAEECGRASVLLGAGREAKDDKIDYLAGIIMRKKRGDAVRRGETIASLYTSEEKSLAEAARRYLGAITVTPAAPAPRPLIFARVDKDGIERF